MKLFDVARITPEQSRYFDAWRGGSAIVVLVGHAFGIFSPNSSPVWGGFATAAVMAFFGLSGFFIHQSLASSFAKGRPLDFVVARVNRIALPFAFAIALTVFLWAIAPALFQTGDRTFAVASARDGYSIEGLVPTSLFLNGFAGRTLSANGPLWSLSFEIWYYVLAFLAGLSVAHRWMLVPTIVIAVGLSIRNPGFAVLGSVWVLGFGISILHAAKRLPDLPQWPFVLLAALALPWFLADQESDFALMAWQLACGTALAVHMAAMLKTTPPRGWIEPSARWAYTLYAIHFPLLLFAYGVLGPRYMLPAALAVLAFAALVGPRLERIKPLKPRSGSQLQKSTLS